MNNKNKPFKKMFLLFIQLLFHIVLFSQEVIINSFEFKAQNILNDIGRGWEKNSMFGPFRYQQIDNIDVFNKSMLSSTRFGISFNGTSSSFYNFSKIHFKSHFYIYKATSLYNSSPGRNLTPNNHNIDFSGMGYQNSWVNLQIGKGNESWGAGTGMQLALSSASKPFNYFKLASDYGNIRVRYIHGFLEQTSDGYNRYITAKGIEWTNNMSFILGMSEIIIYSGENRNFDIGYLNPFSVHLEAEWNNRLNVLGEGNANAVWQISLDWLLNKKVRVSGNYLYDEYVIDPDIQKNKEHGNAYSLRASFNLINFEKNILNLFISHIYVGTPTFRHSLGTNNFVNGGIPLGWEKGSDGYETKFGLNYIKNNIFICVFSFGKQVNGEESITIRSFDPYFDYLKGNFPSGSITTKYNFKLNFEWYLTKQLSTDLGLHYTIPDNDLKKEFIFYFGLNFHFPKDILTSL